MNETLLNATNRTIDIYNKIAEYIQNYLSPNPEQQAQMQQQAPPGQMPNQAGEQNPSLSEPAESSSLAQVGMKDNSQMPNIIS